MALITNLQPPAGSTVLPDTVLSFDVIDPLIEELKVFVWVAFQASGVVELAYDGSSFQPLYTLSNIESIPGGRRFSIRRVGGWPSTPELRVDDCACPPDLGGPAAGTGLRFDNRASPESFVLPAGPGTSSGSIDLGGMKQPVVELLSVGFPVDRAAQIDIEFFTDAGETDRVYFAENRDTSVNDHVDRTPWAAYSVDNDLTGGLLYYKITNDDNAESPATEIKMVATESPIVT